MTVPSSILATYHYGSADAPHTSAYLWEPILSYCKQVEAKRVLDLGCGNGAFCNALVQAGFQTVGCDPSSQGIRFAAEAVPGAIFRQISVDDDPSVLGNDFDVVISTEVVEHLIVPRRLPQFAFEVLRPGGHFILSTPYHGYLKNLAISLADKWDTHLTPFWDGGHIKFWSRKTLTKLLESEGFRVIDFIGTGRIPYLWKSMILVAERSKT